MHGTFPLIESSQYRMPGKQQSIFVRYMKIRIDMFSRLSPTRDCLFCKWHAFHLVLVLHFHSRSTCKDLLVPTTNHESAHSRLTFFSGFFRGGFGSRAGAFRLPRVVLLLSPSSSSPDSSASSSSSDGSSSSDCTGKAITNIHLKNCEGTHHVVVQITELVLVSANIANKFTVPPSLFLLF